MLPIAGGSENASKLPIAAIAQIILELSIVHIYANAINFVFVLIDHAAAAVLHLDICNQLELLLDILTVKRNRFSLCYHISYLAFSPLNYPFTV